MALEFFSRGGDKFKKADFFVEKTVPKKGNFENHIAI